MEGPVVPARLKLTISDNLPPNNVKADVESAGERRHGRSSTAKFSADERGRRRNECIDARRRGHDDVSEEGGATGADSEGHVTGAVNRQQAMNTPEMEEGRKVWKKKCKVARPNDKLVVGVRVIYNTKYWTGRKGRKVQMLTYRLRVLAGPRGALLTHPSDSVNPDMFNGGGSGQRRRAAPL